MTSSLGWYTDPQDPSLWRYWDGSRWTDRIAPKVVFGASVARQTTQRLRRDLAVFLVFGLSLALVPVGTHVIELAGKDELHSWWDMFSTGEIIIIAAVLAGAAVGDFLKMKAGPLTSRQLIIVGLTLVLLFFAGWLYSYVKSDSALDHRELIGYCSLVPLGVSLLIVLSTMLVEPEEVRG